MTSELQQAQSRDLERHRKQPLQQEGTHSGWMFNPDVDIIEQPEEYLVIADLPGVGEKDVRVQLEKGELSIDAQPSVRPDEGWQPIYTEYQPGGYHRTFLMGESIDADRISAHVHNGVLEIHLPKTAHHKAKRIAITQG